MTAMVFAMNGLGLRIGLLEVDVGGHAIVTDFFRALGAGQPWGLEGKTGQFGGLHVRSLDHAGGCQKSDECDQFHTDSLE
ncbi:hypothetical protein N5D48_10200 [Pseudomonas sp. GD03858]|uniref:hypothetical protein n=1 Tax=unclassified Pseudomonas TaxID=196821 RepID=UPI0024474482|nr:MULTISPECIES: hypothetical protein [unclassified Pseudomonas]MDH0647646.1 hypothetical protein [Pseudomonas sp. GD03867]MDH0662774.1 hypothetical protein [Pseudomonas sp. GD03858]